MKKYEDLVDRIRRQIVTGYFPQGEKVPAEKELAESYDVSVQTVNKAFSILVSSGYLERKRGLGTYVADQPSLERLRKVYPYTVGILFEGSVKNIAEADSVLGRMVFKLQHLLATEGFSWVNVCGGTAWCEEIGKTDGIITVGDVKEDFIREAARNRIPVVTFNRDYSDRGLASVMVNTDTIVQLVRTASGLGHRKFIFVTSEPEKQVFAIRYRVFEEAVRALGNPDLSVKRLIIPRECFETRTLDSGTVGDLRDSDFAFLPYDSLAIQFLHLLSANGFSVPEDLSVCGYDDSLAGRHLPVPLTTIAYDTQEACRLLVGTLRKMLAREPFPLRTTVDSLLLLRSSTGKKTPGNGGR